jgi:hypothetical protein
MHQAPRGRPFKPGQSGSPGGRPVIVGELRELARAHAPEAIKELARLALHAKTETARIAAIRELLDRGFGKATHYVAAENEEPDLNDLNLEELRVGILADLERLFSERPLPSRRAVTPASPRHSIAGARDATTAWRCWRRRRPPVPTAAGIFADNPRDQQLEIRLKNLKRAPRCGASRTRAHARMRLRVPTWTVRKTNVRSSEQAILVANNRNPMYIKGPQNQC